MAGFYPVPSVGSGRTHWPTSVCAAIASVGRSKPSPPTLLPPIMPQAIRTGQPGRRSGIRAIPVHSGAANRAALIDDGRRQARVDHLGQFARVSHGADDLEMPVLRSLQENDHRPIDGPLVLLQKDASEGQTACSRRHRAALPGKGRRDDEGEDCARRISGSVGRPSSSSSAPRAIVPQSTASSVAPTSSSPLAAHSQREGHGDHGGE